MTMFHIIRIAINASLIVTYIRIFDKGVQALFFKNSVNFSCKVQ